MGILPTLAKPRLERDPELLRADFQHLLIEELTARDQQVLETVRREIASFTAALESTHENRIDQILTTLADSLGQRFLERDEIFSESLRAVALDIYSTLSARQRQDLQNLNARLNLVEATDEIRGNQTEALMATVWQLSQRQE